MHLEFHLEDYFLSRPTAKTTQAHYRITARIFDSWLESVSVGLESLTESDLNRFLLWYESRGVSPNTVRAKRAVLLALLNFIGVSPNRSRVRLVRKRPKIIDSWTVEQCQTLIFAASKIPGTITELGTGRGSYASVMLAVVFETALRRGDLPEITCSNVRAGRWNQVQNKTGNIVDCQISDVTRSKLVAMPHFGDLPPFSGWTVDHVATLSRLAKRAMKMAWLESDDGPLKKLRRSSITIAESLQPGTGYLQGGHTTPTITRESYIDLSRIDRRRPECG